jgi:hypothetical protein
MPICLVQLFRHFSMSYPKYCETIAGVISFDGLGPNLVGVSEFVLIVIIGCPVALGDTDISKVA